MYACVRTLGIAGCYECSQSPCRMSPWLPSECPLRGRFGEEARYDNFRRTLGVIRGLGVRPGTRVALSRVATDRVRLYLQVVDDYVRRGLPTVSSQLLARSVGVRSGLVRRDLAALGNYGTPGRGYEVEALRRVIRRVLNLEQERAAVWLGARRLREDRRAREALLAMNCRLVAVFDADSRQVGTEAGALAVQPLARAERETRARGAAVAVVATEEAARPEMVQALARAGVKAILNLTPVPLLASARMVIEQADTGSQLLRLLSRLGSTERAEAR